MCVNVTSSACVLAQIVPKQVLQEIYWLGRTENPSLLPAASHPCPCFCRHLHTRSFQMQAKVYQTCHKYNQPKKAGSDFVEGYPTSNDRVSHVVSSAYTLHIVWLQAGCCHVESAAVKSADPRVRNCRHRDLLIGKPTNSGVRRDPVLPGIKFAMAMLRHLQGVPDVTDPIEETVPKRIVTAGQAIRVTLTRHVPGSV